MAKHHHELLAVSLRHARKFARQGIIRSADLSRLDRQRLEAEGWLTRIIRGWYLLKQPASTKGDTTQWYSSFWDFMSFYLNSRFGKNYCLSASASLDLHLGSTTIPRQLLIMVKKGGSSVINLLFNTSIIIYQESTTFPLEIEQVNAINVMPLPIALHRLPAKFFQNQPQEAEIALKLVDLTDISRELLRGTNISAAARIIGAYHFLGEVQRAKKIQTDLIAAGYQIEPTNPFLIKAPLLANYPRVTSPYAARISMMWQRMRTIVLAVFSRESFEFQTSKKYFSRLEKLYVHDAYNSLSIEGYEVSENLIEKIANGKWNPDHSTTDRDQINAMAAKGYRQAFEAVKLSIDRIFHLENSGQVIREDIHVWYSALFSPSVKAGILKPEQLAGYRAQQVYIRGSMHTPLPVAALTDAMEALFNCLINEPDAAVRAVLGHFIFVFIHPYMDGNGRIGRFIMNSLFAAGNFPWTIIRVKNRSIYLKTLEVASVEQDIKPFASFILAEMKAKHGK